MSNFSIYRQLWKQADSARASLPLEYPGWPEAGLAVMGDFGGIQNFVFRPVPGAGGAARRLRSRSFRVSAYAEMVMRWTWKQLFQGEPKTLYAAGGKFLISARVFEGWEAVIQRMQLEVDQWTWKDFGGELVFHLTAVRYSSGRIPHAELKSAMDAIRMRPLERALVSATGWSTQQFFSMARSGDGRCDACAMTQRVRETTEGEWICDGCTNDEAIGKQLPRSRFAHISGDITTAISALGSGMELYSDRNGKSGGEWLAFESSSWPLLRHLPANAGMPLPFEEIADVASGVRKWLGYLRIDGDGAGKHFHRLEGDPGRTWALSRLLNLFFADTANQLISHRFKHIYPVYGGGDDLFVIGPWNQVLDFALELRQELTKVAGDDLTFSAGVSLAKPKEHILTQAEFAREQLESAKKEPGYGRRCGSDQIRALGTTADWLTFEKLLEAAKKITRWVEDKVIPSSLLHQILQLHSSWKQFPRPANGKTTARIVRYKPLLYYQIHRNLEPGEARNWAMGLLQQDSLWPWADFIARYAMLAARRERAKE